MPNTQCLLPTAQKRCPRGPTWPEWSGLGGTAPTAGTESFHRHEDDGGGDAYRGFNDRTIREEIFRLKLTTPSRIPASAEEIFRLNSPPPPSRHGSFHRRQDDGVGQPGRSRVQNLSSRTLYPRAGMDRSIAAQDDGVGQPGRSRVQNLSSQNSLYPPESRRQLP